MKVIRSLRSRERSVRTAEKRLVSTSAHEVTGLLAKWSRGDTEAEKDLFRLVHQELRRIARRYVVRWRRGQTLETTAVVNEAYVRLVAQRGSSWQDRAHFFAVSAKAMRHILIDYARSRGSAKRGGGLGRVTFDEAAVAPVERSADLEALDGALATLAEDYPRRSQVVELRYFGGLTNEEIAEVLKVSPATIERDWRYARAWLHQKLAGA
jgi:RNA polymerase sigma factor (TIGR02999 family)